MNGFYEAVDDWITLARNGRVAEYKDGEFTYYIYALGDVGTHMWINGYIEVPDWWEGEVDDLVTCCNITWDQRSTPWSVDINRRVIGLDNLHTAAHYLKEEKNFRPDVYMDSFDMSLECSRVIKQIRSTTLPF